MTTCTLHEALGAQWDEEHRESLPNELSVEDVQMLFLATEFARHSRQVCHWRKSLFSFVWKELLRAGFPVSFREALVRAGVHDALSKMPYLASGTGDFETDAQDLLAACRERHAFKSKTTSTDAFSGKVPVLQTVEAPTLSTSRGAFIYDDFPKWVGQHHEGLEEILSPRTVDLILSQHSRTPLVLVGCEGTYASQPGAGNDASNVIDYREQYPLEGLSPPFVKQCQSPFGRPKRHRPSPSEDDDDSAE